MKSEFYTGIWTFFCNPKLWAIDEYLQHISENSLGSYFVNRLHIKKICPGQFGVIRVGFDGRTKKELNGRNKLNRGIYAIVEIIDVPKLISGTHDTYWLDSDTKKYHRPVVKIKYLYNLLNNPILISDIKNDHIINQDKYIISGFQSATMPLLPAAFDKILFYIEEQKNSPI